MTAPSSAKEPVSRSPLGHLVALIAAIAFAIAPFSASVASAAPAADPSSVDMSAIAMHQLAAAAGESASCGEPTMSSPFGVFDGRGASALAYLLAAPPPPHGTGDLRVTCALPYTNGKPGGDCTGKHFLQWAHNGTTAARVTAELIALDLSSNQMQSAVILNHAVQSAVSGSAGTAQLASRLSPSDWKFVVATGKNREYTVFAPVPLFKVTVEEDGETAVAYCSNIPWSK